jgi:hypothetical protein
MGVALRSAGNPFKRTSAVIVVEDVSMGKFVIVLNPLRNTQTEYQINQESLLTCP